MDLGVEIENTAAFQKTKLFILGAVAEIEDFGKHLYTSAEKIIKKIDSDGLHVVLAEGIEYIGDKVGEITSEFFVDEVLGFIGNDLFANAAGYILTALDMEKEAKELKEWIEAGLVDMASNLDAKITETADSLGALVRDPKEWAERIEEDPS